MRGLLLIILSCLVLKSANALPWYSNRQRNTFYRHHNHCECGKKNLFFPTSRILGGEEVFENEFPWMAGIRSVNRSSLICGATIISDRYVLSAAHCIPYGFDKNDLKVSVGTHNACNWDSKTIIFSVEDIFPHPNYDSQTHFADIMLVKVVMKITFNKFVQPICLPKTGFDNAFRLEEHAVSALGWGFSEVDTLYSKTCGLRIAELTLFKQSDCSADVSSLICAGHKTIPRGTCGGDSGGPLQILNKNDRYVLIGITSNGGACASLDYPDFYTDVVQMLPWIMQITSRDSTHCSS